MTDITSFCQYEAKRSVQMMCIRQSRNNNAVFTPAHKFAVCH